MPRTKKQVESEEIVTINNNEQQELNQTIECHVQRVKLINSVDKATGVIQFTGNVSITIDVDVSVQKRIEDEDGIISYVVEQSNTFTMPFSVLLACLHNNCKQVLIQPIISYYLGKLVEKSTNDIGLELTMLLNGAKAICVYEIKRLDANKTVGEEHTKIVYGFEDIVFTAKSLEKPVTIFNHLFKGMDMETAAKVARKQLRLGEEPEYLI